MAATASPSTTGTPLASGPLRMTAGRRAALLFGVPLCLLAIGSTGLNLVAELGQGKYPVSYTAAASAKAFDISVDGGNLNVNPGAASHGVTLVGTAKYSLIRSKFTIGTEGNGVTKASYQCPMPVGNCELDATLTVPPAMPFTSSSGGGDVTVTGLTSPVSLSTGGGNMLVNGTSGRLHLASGGGDVNGMALKSPAVKVSTGGGNVELIFVTPPDNVQVSTGGGDITIVVPADSASYAVGTSTGGGDINNDLGNVPSSSRHISVSTGGGNITIRRA